MKSNPYPIYEDATRDYLAKISALMQAAQEPGGTSAAGAVELPVEILVQRAEEIADISSKTIQLADGYLNSADPRAREGIRYHFIDQAAVELLLGIELLQVSAEKAGTCATAAIKATHSAALREAVSAVGKSSSAPIVQGLPTEAGYRISESATSAEAIAGLRMAVDSTAGNISKRVQELGGDIAFDLVSGTEWAEVSRGAALSGEDMDTILESVSKGIAGRMLLHVYRKITALLGSDAPPEARNRIQGWLLEIKQAGRVDIFNEMVGSYYGVEALKKSVSEVERSSPPVDSINRASDLIKAFSDRFIVLIGRMRKLEDAIRLGKQVELPQFRLLTIALQVALLSALVYAGRDYIGNGLSGVLYSLKATAIRS